MPLEIITNFLPITDDMDLFTKINVETNNNAVRVMAKSIQESYDKIAPTDKGDKKAIITLSATLDKSLDIKREYLIL